MSQWKITDVTGAVSDEDAEAVNDVVTVVSDGATAVGDDATAVGDDVTAAAVFPCCSILLAAFCSTKRVFRMCSLLTILNISSENKQKALNFCD